MKNDAFKIVVIDDNLKYDDPLIVELVLGFPEATVILKNKPNEGVEYILANLNSKMIVLQDYNLGKNEPNGTHVFLRIREKTTLIYFIIMTANQLTSIPNADLVQYINNDALAIINNTDDIKDIISLVNEAAHKLDVRIDCLLEQWINRHSEEEQNAPYITTASGNTYTLRQLLHEIRMRTDVGKEMERNVLLLTVDLLTRGKEKVND